MKEPIVTSNTDYIKTGARKKGDPMDSDTFARAKQLLRKGLDKNAICEQTVISRKTLALIEKCDTYADYRELRYKLSNWHKGQKWNAPKQTPTKKPSLWARLVNQR